MKNLFRTIRLAFKANRYAAAPFWSDDNRRDLLIFLQSDTGRTFSALMQNMVIRHMSSAVGKSNDLHYECGFATGFRGCLTTIESLAATTPPRPLDLDSTEGLDHLSP
jgi:hypothetical protein